MSILFLAIALTIFAAPLLKSVGHSQGRILASSYDGTSILIGFLITAGVAAMTSPLMGFGFVFAVLLHELGAALAIRIVGHEVARVRIVPLPFVATPRSDREFESALHESFVALYAPALAIVPLVLALALSHVLAPITPAVADFIRVSAIMLGAFNFIMLLPFAPLAGGHVVRAVSEAFWPQMSVLVTVFMTAAFATAAVRDGSIAMLVLAGAGVQSILYKRRTAQARLSLNNALLVMACYAFILTVHFTGGWWLLNELF